MVHFALFGGSFLEPDPINYLFGAGIATNIGAAFVCVLIGWAWSRTKFWPLHAIHVRLDALHQSHEDLHAKLAFHEALHMEQVAKLDRIAAQLKHVEPAPGEPGARWPHA